MSAGILTEKFFEARRGARNALMDAISSGELSRDEWEVEIKAEADCQRFLLAMSYIQVPAP